MGIGIKIEKRRATAVFANPNLKDGQRINILKIAYYATCKINDFEIGVIMVSEFQSFLQEEKLIRKYWIFNT